jgi:hypothetical protein
MSARYGHHHRTIRARLAPIVRTGTAMCARCGQFIGPNEPWDLGHDDADPTRYAGPEHQKCNRGTINNLRRALEEQTAPPVSYPLARETE